MKDEDGLAKALSVWPKGTHTVVLPSLLPSGSLTFFLCPLSKVL